LVDAAVKIAKEFGASKLILSVAVKNAIGHEFFETCGFSSDDDRDDIESELSARRSESEFE
jgi:hypothetical protein